MAEIVVVGSLNMDLVLQAHRMPSAGETVRGTAFSTVPGGKGANQAAAVALLGGQVAMIGCVGDDAFGERLLRSLGSLGVDLSIVRKLEGVSTGIAAILVDGVGENRIIVIPGANGLLTPDELTSAEARIAKASLLVLQLEVPMPTVETAIRLAVRHGVPVLLNPAPPSALDEALLAQVNYLVLNETEAQVLTGIEPVDADSCRGAAQSLCARGVGVVILTLGERGAYVFSSEGGLHVPARPVRVVDTTAAGDAFIGGLAVSLVEGRSLGEATRFACAAGTLAVTRLGAQTSIPARAEVEKLLAQTEEKPPVL